MSNLSPAFGLGSSLRSARKGNGKTQGDLALEAGLTRVRRQEEKWMRDAVRSFERGDVRKAITAYFEHGHFHVKEVLAAVIKQWKADGGVNDPSRVFVLASLDVEVKEINLQAQAARILEGEVDADRKLYANGVFFHVGDRLQFQKRSRAMAVENADTATVLDVDPGWERIKVRLDEEGRVQASRSVISTHLFCDKHTVGGPEMADLIRSLSHESGRRR